jgi:hypothetical protein
VLFLARSISFLFISSLYFHSRRTAMSGANGRADPREVSAANRSGLVSDLKIQPAESRFPPEKIRQLVSELEVPFDESSIDWRVTNSAKGEQRGQVVPYANSRAYTDRLNALFTPGGWTRKYTVNTSANFERAKDKKVVAKVLVTCELTIFGLGSHSATGEEFADRENALTTAEAQSFKRVASCFGLGRYLYQFKGVWVHLDERKRPTSSPRLFVWATPQGWRAGQRPGSGGPAVLGPVSDRVDEEKMNGLVHDIEEIADTIGRRLYRGVLKSVARVWNPSEIHDQAILQTVLNEMRAADGELRRLDAALNQGESGHCCRFSGPWDLVLLSRSTAWTT